MMYKKGFLGKIAVFVLLLITLLIILHWMGFNLFPAVTKAFNFLINMISVSYGKTPDIIAGELTPPAELNQAYNNLVILLKNSKYNNECLIYNMQFPQDFQSYSIVLERSYQKDYNGLFLVIKGPKGEEIKRDFIEQKYPCVVTGQTQVKYFVNKFILKQPDNTQQKYASVNKITIKGKNQIVVNYESGAPLTNGVLDNSNLMFNIDSNNVCFLPVYSFMRLFEDPNKGIPPRHVSTLAQQQTYACK